MLESFVCNLYNIMSPSLHCFTQNASLTSSHELCLGKTMQAWWDMFG